MLDVNVQWASPLNWAALNANAVFPVDNAIVVEAVNRRGARAMFSNRGGHVSAPGTDILSTIGGGFAVDEGTSMAAPHVTALAALLIAYDPTITSNDIARAIRGGAHPVASGAAPQIDALGALAAHDPQALRYLADLDLDGGGGSGRFRSVQGSVAEAAGVADAAITDGGDSGAVIVDAVTNNVAPAAADEDFNGNGVTDLDETAWPLIDLNGSGVATDDDCDRIEFGGRSLTDLDVMGVVWTDADTPFDRLSAEICAGCPPTEG